jgi:hypothetical protein
MMTQTLDQFIERVRGHSGRGNEWVSEPQFHCLYVRYGRRHILGRSIGDSSFEDVLDIATVEVEEELRGTGVFTRLVARLRKTYPGMSLFVENAAPAFCPLLLRLGFVPVPYDSFFLEGEKP